MRVHVNGEAREVADGATLADLLRAAGAPLEGVAVEVNRELVRRAEHAGHRLRDGDRVEIVGLVGGG